jgi:hypothetical protein
LKAATFSFFSAMRFAIRVLNGMCIVSWISGEGGDQYDALELRLLFLLVFQPANLESMKATTALET